MCKQLKITEGEIGMNLFPSASGASCAPVKPTDNTASDKKNISFESVMVNVGSLVTYLAAAAVRRTAFLLGKAAAKIINGANIRRKHANGLASDTKRIGKIKNAVRGIKTEFADGRRKFSERKSEVGAAKALALQLSDIAEKVKNSKRFAATVVNYTVPAVCVAFLICVVANKASADYGVTVEYNGQEIGVVSEEAVLNSAQEVISERSVYYDTNSDTYITATLSLKPLGAQDEIIDEQTLADAIQEQIDIRTPEESVPVGDENNGSEPAAQSTAENIENTALNIYGEVIAPGETAPAVSSVPGNEQDGRERAFVVTVDGEVIGAVKANDEIADFLEEKKEKYLTDDIVEVSFDKDIEYTYEQFVEPDEIIDQDEIIGKLDSIVSEPLYYEIREGDNPWSIAHNNGMTTDELVDCNITFKGETIDDLTQYCPVGAIVQLSEEVPYLQVLTTREVEYTEAIDYEIVKTKDPDMYKGDSEVDVPGVEGEKKVRAMVTYRGDVAVSTEIVEETVIAEPVTKYMRVGTRETTTPVSTGTGGSGTYFWPTDGGYISAYQGDGRGHKGIDIAAPYGTPIYAAESGTVIETGDGWNGGYGNCVRVQHDDGNVTVYAHQSSIAVSYGDHVVKGQLLGYVGSTGDSTGNHLHFEVRSYGTYANPLDYVSQY